MRTAVYPGSFDPVTLGHYDIIERTAKMVDKLIIGVLNNKAKCPLFSAQERVNMNTNFRWRRPTGSLRRRLILYF